MGLRDRFNKFSGKTRFVVCRLFLHFAGSEATPVLGTLNQVAREVVAADGDLEIAGEGLVKVCQTLLDYDGYWYSAANEGDVIWDEGEAGDYFNELLTDSATRYLSSGEVGGFADDDDPLTLPPTGNLVVMIAIACEGEVPALEDDLASYDAMSDALKALIDLHYNGNLRGIQLHFSPAQLGDELTEEQLLLNFPELIRL